MPASKLTSKGQTTIPADVRNALNVHPGDRILYEIDGDRVTMRSARQVIAALHGRFARPELGPQDLNAARDRFEQEMAAKAVEQDQP